MSIAPALHVPPALWRAVAHLQLAARGILTASALGPRRHGRQGQSLSFREHRAYVRGDDVRHVDWHLWARTGRAYVKVFDASATTPLVLGLDVSASMHTGDGPQQKLYVAATVALALAQLAQQSGDAIGLWLFGGESLTYLAPRHDRQRLLQITTLLAGAMDAGPAASDQKPPVTRLAPTLLRSHERFRTVLIGDWLPGSLPLGPTLQALRGRGHACSVVHVLHPDERTLPGRGAHHFVDPETGATRLVDVDAVRADYQRALAAHAQAVANAAERAGAQLAWLRDGSEAVQAVQQVAADARRIDQRVSGL